MPRVRVIGSDGEMIGVLTRDEALAKAEEEGLDLVEIQPNAEPPVCKIMDFGKHKYETKLKKRQNAKKQHKVVTKEVRLRPKTGEHDYMVKVNQAKGFLGKGFKVQVNVLFRGRERQHSDIAQNHLDRFVKEVELVGKIEVPPRMEGFRMFMIVAPK